MRYVESEPSSTHMGITTIHLRVRIEYAYACAGAYAYSYLCTVAHTDVDVGNDARVDFLYNRIHTDTSTHTNTDANTKRRHKTHT